MSSIYQSFKIAFSMYSKIPVRKINWKEENMKYVMCFFPWVGILIGAVLAGTFLGAEYIERQGFVFSEIFKTALWVIIPLIITGGIHMDGFLDTADALSSYQEKEKRLEILKDPHAGAFAIIVGIGYFIIYFGICSMITVETILPVALVFVFSRILSGLSVVSFPLAKGSGLVWMFSDNSKKKMVRWVMAIYLIIIAGVYFLMGIFRGQWIGPISVLSGLLTYGHYYKMSKAKFGGITGDLAGYFLQVCELVMIATIVIGNIFM